MKNKVDSILGLQFGDCGKGKIIDILSKNYDIIARFNGADNAGHSIVIDNIKYVLHSIPSGIFRPNCINIIGSGCLINPISLVNEIKSLKKLGIDVKNKLKISKRAHLILPTHLSLDNLSELLKGDKKIGSTLKGICPAYMDKTGRNGIRIGDIGVGFIDKYKELTKKHLQILNQIENEEFELDQNKWLEAIKYLDCEFIDSEYYINNAIKDGKTILAEGAQGSLLDIDYGTYPFVTSSSTTISGVCSGLGISPHTIGNISGIFKAYTTRVGSGPFPTELNDETGEKIRKIGCEFGSTTGRPRRCGWLDLPALKYAIMINGITELHIMKMDVLSEFEKIKICIGYNINGIYKDTVPFNTSYIIPDYIELDGWMEDISNCKSFYELPKKAIEYIKYIQLSTNCKITIISVGPDRKQTIFQ